MYQYFNLNKSFKDEFKYDTLNEKVDSVFCKKVFDKLIVIDGETQNLNRYLEKFLDNQQVNSNKKLILQYKFEEVF